MAAGPLRGPRPSVERPDETGSAAPAGRRGRRAQRLRCLRLHRRHDRGVEGSDALALQHRVQRLSGGRVHQRVRAGQGWCDVRPALLPLVRSGRDELRGGAGREAGDASPFRPRHGPKAAGEGAADVLPGRAPPLHRAERGTEHRQVRPAFSEGVLLGGRAAAQGGGRPFPRGDGRQPGRGVRDVRVLTGDAPESIGRAAPGHDRDPPSRHRLPDHRPDRPRPRGCRRRAGGALRQGASGHAGLLEQARGDGRDDPQRLAPHRRHRHHGRGRLLPDRGPVEGHNPGVRFQRVPDRGRGRVVSASRRAEGLRRRRARRGDRRARQGIRRVEARRIGHRGRDHPMVP